MDNQRSHLLTWAYYCHGKSMDELRQSLLLATLELETTRVKAQEELKMREDELNHLNSLLAEAIREKDQVQEKCQRLLFDKILLQHQLQKQQHQRQQIDPISGISSVEEEPGRGLDTNNGFSSSDSEEIIVSSPVIDPIPLAQLRPRPLPPSALEPAIPLVFDKPLPEKGKLLQAVMKAGPLLQTLLLAGPLPQWRHPPPPLDSHQIPPPPVALPPPSKTSTQFLHQDSPLKISLCEDCGRINKKRDLCEYPDSPVEIKCIRPALH
ncbi:hypothetical protein NMG60_11015629 [Bertholletia excelsa]